MKTNAIFPSILITAATLSATLFFSNCTLSGDVFGAPEDGNGNKCLAVSDVQTNRTLTLQPFNALVVGDDWGRFAHILVEHGDEYRILISGPDNVVDVTTANVNNGELTLSLGNCFVGNTDLTVRITTPEMTRIGNHAFAANIVMTGFGNTGTFNIDNSAHADWTLDVHCTKLELLSTSPGKFNITGKADRLEATFYDFSSMAAFGLDSRTADITSNVQGDIDVTVTEHLDARILNAGNIKYKGHPEIASVISGTGKVIDAN